jgi:hypothetical protein
MDDWTARINNELEALGVSPEMEAFEIQDATDHIVLIDTHDITVYRHAEGVHRVLSGLDPGEDERATYAAVYQALLPHIVLDMRVFQDDHGCWRVDHAQPED